MPPKQITLKRRSEQIMVHTTPEVKKRLQAIADARGWSLSLLGHEIFKSQVGEEDDEKDIAYPDRAAGPDQ